MKRNKSLEAKDEKTNGVFLRKCWFAVAVFWNLLMIQGQKKIWEKSV